MFDCLLGRSQSTCSRSGARGHKMPGSDLGVSHCDAKTLEEMPKREWEGSAFSLRMGVVNSENWG